MPIPMPGLLGQPPQRNAGLLGSMPPPVQQSTHKPNLLDRILGLYGADPATHIPDEQRRGALGRGLMNAGIATAMAGGRGHDSLTPAQAMATFLGTMQQTGPQMAQESKALQTQQRIQEALRNGNMNETQMRAAMMELIAAGDIDGARAISEVLKSNQGNKPIRMDDDTLYDPTTGQWLQDPNAGPNADIAGWRNNLQHPEGKEGQFAVPYDKSGRMLWELAQREAPDPYQRDDRNFQRERSLTNDYQKELGNIEESLRLVETGIRASDAALAGDGPAQIGLLYSFVKALDPNSVVREGEVRLAQEAASLWQRMRGLYDKYLRGEAVVIPGDMAAQMADYLKRLQASNMDYVGRVNSAYQDRGGRWGVDPTSFRDPRQGLTPYSIKDLTARATADRAAYQSGLTPEQAAKVDEVLEGFDG